MPGSAQRAKEMTQVGVRHLWAERA
eukprot:SAG11_NODE_20690_length_440_cov_0.879765_1_plen_24_part_10